MIYVWYIYIYIYIYIYNYHINDINKACYENYNDCFYIFSNQLDKIIRINLFIKIF